MFHDTINMSSLSLLDMPPEVVERIFRSLGASDLLRISASCKDFQALAKAASDKLWKTLALDVGWNRPATCKTWKKYYCEEASKRCRDCWCVTPYEFALLGRRLCTQCERGSHRYRLVTALQSEDEFSVPQRLVMGLRSITLGGTIFYLKSDVLALVGNSSSSTRAVTPLLAHAQAEEEEAEDDVEVSSDDVDGEDTREVRQQELAKDAAQQKIQRKQNKKAAKMLQRAKRQGQDIHLLTLGATLGTTTPGQREHKKRSNDQRKYRRKSEAVAMGHAPSAWERQRKKLEEEFGQFGLSGLTLVEDKQTSGLQSALG
ncbi:hypothetical protein CYMTET_55704 [Cymbomonas tetramitiformis]|uniref:F-box domain-containing protein n=1 Tax=Cymbomonas tetramitiformis TaxID=36881 RepID=A0AAE0BDT7_9CHLO|nr:hypothetical protein CYMTET_55704 [Cymbomonas tetramitiformis]